MSLCIIDPSVYACLFSIFVFPSWLSQFGDTWYWIELSPTSISTLALGYHWIWTDLDVDIHHIYIQQRWILLDKKKSEYNPFVSQCFEYSLTATSNDTLSILFILCICQCVPLSQFASCNVFYCNASFYGFLQCFFCGSFPISSVFAISWCLLFPLLHWQ